MHVLDDSDLMLDQPLRPGGYAPVLEPFAVPAAAALDWWPEGVVRDDSTLGDDAATIDAD